MLHAAYRSDKGTYQDTSASTTASADTDPVALWQDQSNNQMHLVAGTAPILKLNQINGLPSIRFNGTTQYLRFSQRFVAVVRTMYALVKVPSTATYTIVCGTSHSLQWRVDAQKQQLVDCVVADIGKGSTSMSTGAWTQINSTWDGSSAVYRMSGAADGTASAADYTASHSNRVVGRNDNTLDEYFRDDLACLLIYGEVHTLAQKQAVEAWITSVFGV